MVREEGLEFIMSLIFAYHRASRMLIIRETYGKDYKFIIIKYQ